MERTQLFDLMGELKLYGMKAAYDEIMATAVKRQHEPQRIVGDLLTAEISERGPGKQRLVKAQLLQEDAGVSSERRGWDRQRDAGAADARQVGDRRARAVGDPTLVGPEINARPLDADGGSHLFFRRSPR